MAIDTAQDRRSVAGVHLQPAGPGVTPDATPGLEWRQEAGYGYSGVAVETPETTGGFYYQLILQRRRG